MTERLHARMEDALDRVARGDRSSEDVLEALAYVLAVACIDGRPPRLDRERIARIEARARRVLHEAERDADEDVRSAARLARAGLDVLCGRHPREPLPRDLLPPSPLRLVDLLAGRLDGLASASCALAQAATEGGRKELALLRHLRGGPEAASPPPVAPQASTRAAVQRPRRSRTPGSTPPVDREHEAPVLALAARSRTTMRDPSRGRSIARLDDPPVEAVLFGRGRSRELALYAAAAVPLRFVASGLRLVDLAGGYFLGRIAAGVRRLDGWLHAGDHRVRWRLSLDDTGPRTSRGSSTRSRKRRGRHIRRET
ncbi:MAG: hypothetical protein NZ898_05935 [Myxococcota bacterium]|nr:hypothetical protein [Myxococcota bacterium]MDW8361447.1 hypothetical protein [Myxococcales bacterium]